jgi:hypothetical protein
LSSDKKKMSLCQKQRQQIIISITHTSTFNVTNKDIYIYIRKKKRRKSFFLPDMVHNEARSLLVLSSTMPDEYICMCSMINKALQWLSHSLFLPLLVSLSLPRFACVQFGRVNFFLKMRMGKNERCVCVCVCSLDLIQIVRMYKKSNKYLIHH